MKKFSFTLIVPLLVLLSLSRPIQAEEEAGETTALAIMEESHLNFYYAADGGRSKVEMTLTNKKGRTRVREFWMFRTDIEDLGDQNYYAYFIKPADVRRMAILTLKHAKKSDDRWLYVPAIDLVKRLAASDNHSAFVGSDFTYEDVSGRLPALDSHERLPDTTLNDKPVIVIKSTPVDPKTAKYAWRVSWIDQEVMLPVQEEFYNKKGEVSRRMVVDRIETIEDIPTAVERTMTTLKSKHSSTITFNEVSYKVDIKANKYNERLLKNPPAQVRK